MSIAALTPEIVTLDQAKAYLREPGLDQDLTENLRIILNGIHGWVHQYTRRKWLLSSGSTQIVEYVNGRGDDHVELREWPITSLDEVVLYPHHPSATVTITGPGTSLYNDDMYWEADPGIVTLITYSFPDGRNLAKVTYKAGYASDSHEIATIRAAMLELLQFHWMRLKSKDLGIEMRKKDQESVTFKDQDIDPAVLRQLEPFRRVGSY